MQWPHNGVNAYDPPPTDRPAVRHCYLRFVCGDVYSSATVTPYALAYGSTSVEIVPNHAKSSFDNYQHNEINMNIVSYGGGTNSTAMLIECAKRGIKVDLILFADTGGEKPHTYNYVKLFSDWLVANGMQEIITVKKVRANGEVLTLEQNCLEQSMLPSIAYGYKSCSQKYKIQPQDKYVNNWPPAKEIWASGNKITKLIGYDTDESHRSQKDYSDDKYSFSYPLIQWGMSRKDCIDSIKSVGLCLPGKSACYFCHNSKPSEIKQLAQVYPDLMSRAITMEQNANLTHIAGLGRNYAWKDVIATDEMFADEYHFTPEMACECYDG